jgi:flavin-dependent dehydrogenase
MIARFSPLHVLVVGAGPAGATAARVLAAAGATVRILDRSAFPRNKPCGGGISMRALARFPDLERELSRIATHFVSRLHLEGPDGDSTMIESRRPATLMVRRVEFDALLLSLAEAAGAEVIAGADVVQARETRERVTLTTRDGRRFEAPIVIAADGVHSVVARRLGLNRGWNASAVALDMMEETPRTALRDLDPSALWVAYGYDAIADRGLRNADRNPQPPGNPQSLRNPQSSIRNGAIRNGAIRNGAIRDGAIRTGAAPEGYAYIFPKRDHVNIGIGYVLSHYRENVAAAPYDLQRSLVARLRERGILDGESVRANFTPFLIPVGGPLRDAARGRVQLAGDAGGFVNGFTAEGIYYAMVSGDLAARAVLRTAGDPSAVAAAYRRACHYEIGAELRDSVAIQHFLFADRRRIARVIDGAQREASVTRLIVDFAAGGGSYRTFRRRLLARSPRLAARLIWERLGRLGLKNSVVERGPAF